MSFGHIKQQALTKRQAKEFVKDQRLSLSARRWLENNFVVCTSCQGQGIRCYKAGIYGSCHFSTAHNYEVDLNVHWFICRTCFGRGRINKSLRDHLVQPCPLHSMVEPSWGKRDSR